jgi:hypothetical protein
LVEGSGGSSVGLSGHSQVAPPQFPPGAAHPPARQRPRLVPHPFLLHGGTIEFIRAYATNWLDDGQLWPNSFALKALTAAEEATIAELVKKAVS